jgi:hypothetical protein
VSPAGGVLLAYFFGQKLKALPTLSQVDTLSADEATRCMRVGDHALANGEWVILGTAKSWKRADWPLPDFARIDPLGKRAWRVTYESSDPNKVKREEPIDLAEAATLQHDSLLGSRAAETVLASLLK